LAVNVGPVPIFDKSALQALSLDEAVWFDNFYLANITPLFFVEAQFHTGWFVESLATQVLVIFVIRIGGNPPHSWPSRWLVATSLAVVATAMLLPVSSLGPALGFVPLPVGFYRSCSCSSASTWRPSRS
jgi:hypothetical protein